MRLSVQFAAAIAIGLTFNPARRRWTFMVPGIVLRLHLDQPLRAPGRDLERALVHQAVTDSRQARKATQEAQGDLERLMQAMNTMRSMGCQIDSGEPPRASGHGADPSRCLTPGCEICGGPADPGLVVVAEEAGERRAWELEAEHCIHPRCAREDSLAGTFPASQVR